MTKFAWVTLATNDSYSLGALVLAHSLKRVNTQHQLVVLITPGVSETMKQKLSETFNLIQEVNVLDSQDSANLALLARPELGITFTKLNCWRLIQFEKCVFLDADILILQNCDELFERDELSAAPDVGWPDCFNSGVFVFKPNFDTFTKLLEFAVSKGSFDGGDQGLLNLFFSDWAHGDINKHLPFIYNTCSTACYSYLPAFKQFSQNIKIMHFIGKLKPWLINFDSCTRKVIVPQEYLHLTDYLQHWWNIFCENIHPQLSTDMNKNDENQQESVTNNNNNNNNNNQIISNEIRWYEQPKFQYIPPTDIIHNDNTDIPPHSNDSSIIFIDPWDNYYKKLEENINNYNAESSITHSNEFDNITNANSEECNYNIDHHNDPYTEYNIISNWNQSVSNKYENLHTEIDSGFQTADIDTISTFSQNQSNNTNYNDNNKYNVSTISNDTFTESINNSELDSKSNSIFSDKNHSPNYLTSEHPQQSIYHLIQENKDDYNDVESLETATNMTDDVGNHQEGGIAGALANLTLGTARTPEQEAFEDNMRRQCWEAGNIDYLGRDSFDNIWKRISQTIAIKTAENLNSKIITE